MRTANMRKTIIGPAGLPGRLPQRHPLCDRRPAQQIRTVADRFAAGDFAERRAFRRRRAAPSARFGTPQAGAAQPREV